MAAKYLRLAQFNTHDHMDDLTPMFVLSQVAAPFGSQPSSTVNYMWIVKSSLFFATLPINPKTSSIDILIHLIRVCDHAAQFGHTFWRSLNYYGTFPNIDLGIVTNSV